MMVLSMFAAGCSKVEPAFLEDPNWQSAVAPGESTGLVSGIANMKTESFKQTNDQKIDILVVIDNSGSMGADQEKIGMRFNNFISSLANKNWQIGITTTAVEGGSYSTNGELLDLTGASGAIITPTTPNAQDVFYQTVVRDESNGCSGCLTGSEQPMKAIKMALEKKDTANANFFRQGADFAALILSDEDEQSNRPTTATAPIDVLNTFRNAFGTSKRFTAHSFVIKPGDTSCLATQTSQLSDGNTSYYGSAAAELSQLTGGKLQSICDEDFGQSLNEVSANLLTLITRIDLKESPKPGTTIIELDPADTTVRFQVQGKTVVFQKPPKAGTDIKISYQSAN
jgi:hypothetical protein